MALLSLIIPVYRVEEYLAPCLDSIFAQSFTDVEVIAVNDASDDGCAEILSRYAGRHPELKVITHDLNRGLGAARNTGIAHATGEYVWCVDSDDWLPEGALAAVAERLARTGPDLLVTGYARVYPDGRIEHHRVTDVGGDRPAPETFTFADQPGLLNVLWIACNKVIRRRFLDSSGLAFGPGWYEDVAFVVPLMLAADRISLLDHYCYAYRQRPAGAITYSTNGRHFEVFDQWGRVFAFMDAQPGRSEPLRALIFERMIWHCLQVLGHASRVPKARRREFFARIARQYHQHLPASGVSTPAGNDGVKQRLVAQGAYQLYEALLSAWQLRKWLLGLARPTRGRAVTTVRVPEGTGWGSGCERPVADRVPVPDRIVSEPPTRVVAGA